MISTSVSQPCFTRTTTNLKLRNEEWVMGLSTKYLKSLIPISHFEEEVLQQLCGMATQLHLSKGEEIYPAGSHDDHIYYLLEGTLAMIDRQAHQAVLDANSDQANYAFGTLKPRPATTLVRSAKALVIRFNAKEFETLITWHNQLSQKDDEPSESPSEKKVTLDKSWMMALLRSDTFFRIPPENLEALVQRMEAVRFAPRQLVVRQGEEGDYYYIIREGRCRVIVNDTPVTELNPLDAFGEEAILSGAPRNASIKMLTRGLLMRLSKADFEELLVPPLVHQVVPQEALAKIQQGAVLVDVRSVEEYQHHRLVRSINLPLFILRAKLANLDPDATYIVYCETGLRSSAACFIMAQQGFNVLLMSNPQEAFHLMSA
jgi:CRP-like cAMP-binding protein